MQNIDYTYRFHNITEKQAPVDVTIHKTAEKRTFSVAANDSQFIDRPSNYLPTKLADLVDIATAVFTADHMATRRGEMPCGIEIILPVRNPDYYNQPHIIGILKDSLYWYTEDIWSFKFVLREGCGRSSELQPRLLPGRDGADEVALWSGGLDSLAGICNRFSDKPSTRFILFGTGGDRTALGRQATIASLANAYLGDNFLLMQVPLHLRYSGVYKIRDLNKICRSRGFVFLVLGSVCALLEGRDELFVYENGVGAINLNFSSAELGLDHTRSVHPKSLIKVSNLISEVTGSSFTIRNPFIFYTKGQMCEIFHRLPGSLRARIPLTVSCDREQRKPGRRLQCGRCSSCLLRHLALMASGIGDQTEYDNYPVQRHIPSNSHYWAMSQQVDTMRPLLIKEDAWDHLALEYPDTLPDLARELSAWSGSDMSSIQRQIIGLYTKHISEWEYLQYGNKSTMLLYQNPNFAHKVVH
jgi:hypothetical protein